MAIPYIFALSAIRKDTKSPRIQCILGPEWDTRRLHTMPIRRLTRQGVQKLKQEVTCPDAPCTSQSDGAACQHKGQRLPQRNRTLSPHGVVQFQED